MNKVFKRKYKGPTGGDCTAPYTVTLMGDPTVAEVIAQITEKTDEWGIITICKEDGKTKRVDYKYGKCDAPSNAKYMNSKVKRASAAGGWTRMDYTLEIAG